MVGSIVLIIGIIIMASGIIYGEQVYAKGKGDETDFWMGIGGIAFGGFIFVSGLAILLSN